MIMIRIRDRFIRVRVRVGVRVRVRDGLNTTGSIHKHHTNRDLGIVIGIKSRFRIRI
jgi:hypothetical protein